MIHSPQSLRYSEPLSFLPEAVRESIVAIAFPRTQAGVLDTVEAPVSETWRALETLHHRGLVRLFGLSNFDRGAIAKIVGIARVPPTLFQVAFNPVEKHEDVLFFCHERRISMIGHSPLAPDGLLEDPDLQKIFAGYGKTPAQTVLYWAVQRGVVSIPSSVQPDHISANLEICDFEISETEMRTIDNLETDPCSERARR